MCGTVTPSFLRNLPISTEELKSSMLPKVKLDSYPLTIDVFSYVNKNLHNSLSTK